MRHSAKTYRIAPRQFSSSVFGVVALAAALLFSPHVDAQNPIAVGVSKGLMKQVYAESRDIPMGAATHTFAAHGITFNIWYLDVINNTGLGFDTATSGAARQARLTDTLTYVADILNDTGTLDVVVELSLTTGTGFLARAGTFMPCADGFHEGSTLFRLDNGFKQFGAGTEEIFVEVNFGYNWNASTSAPAGNEFDLYSVLLHEITHGLGSFSLTDSAGASQFSDPDPMLGCGTPVFDTFTTYDTLVVTSENANLWSGNPPSLQVNVSELTSRDLFFQGPNAITAYGQGGTQPGIFAPGPGGTPPDNVFIPGSSISHWDTGNIVGGAVMEHAIFIGTQRREYNAIGIGGLVDIGYTNAAAEDPLDPDNVFVDFGLTNGNGASTSPFNNLTEAVAAANAAATININGNSTAETFTGGGEITKALTLLNTSGGSAYVGAITRIPSPSTSSGFVSRDR